jgi:hypothetical protein
MQRGTSINTDAHEKCQSVYVRQLLVASPGVVLSVMSPNGDAVDAHAQDGSRSAAELLDNGTHSGSLMALIRKHAYLPGYASDPILIGYGQWAA